VAAGPGRPGGTRARRLFGVGADGEGSRRAPLAAQAAVGLASGVAPFTGTFRPAGRLAAFNGLLAKGVWTLEVSDNEALETGTLRGWSLTLTSAAPLPDLRAVYFDVPVTAAHWGDTLPIDYYVANRGVADAGPSSPPGMGRRPTTWSWAASRSPASAPAASSRDSVR